MTQEELARCITSVQVIRGNTYTTYAKPDNATYEELGEAIAALPSAIKKSFQRSQWITRYHD